MRILITGGAGFIGQALLIHLTRDQEHQVTVLDSFSEQIHGSQDNIQKVVDELSAYCEVIKGDVRDRVLIDRLVKEHDAIYHLAAETGTGQSMYQIERYCDINVRGTAVILEAMASPASRISKLVLASSRAIYGEGRYECKQHRYVYPTKRDISNMEAGDFDLACPICGSAISLLATDENSIASPQSIYAVTKLSQEQLVMTAGQAMGVSVCSLRFQNVYGPGQSLKNPYTGILSIFSTAILQGESINIFEDGLESRDFVFIDDVVVALQKAMVSDRSNQQIINVGSGVPTAVIDVANFLFKAYQLAPSIEVSGQFRVGDIRHNYADVAKALDCLDFQASVSFEQGLTKFTEWVKTQKREQSLYKSSLSELSVRGLFK